MRVANTSRVGVYIPQYSHRSATTPRTSWHPARNPAERAIDRMAMAGRIARMGAINRMRIFYKALERSLIDMTG